MEHQVSSIPSHKFITNRYSLRNIVCIFDGFCTSRSARGICKFSRKDFRTLFVSNNFVLEGMHLYHREMGLCCFPFLCLLCRACNPHAMAHWKTVAETAGLASMRRGVCVCVCVCLAACASTRLLHEKLSRWHCYASRVFIPDQHGSGGQIPRRIRMPPALCPLKEVITSSLARRSSQAALLPRSLPFAGRRGKFASYMPCNYDSADQCWGAGHHECSSAH